MFLKRPVAFRFKNDSDAWVYTENEAEASGAIDLGHDSQALYVRDGSSLTHVWQPISTAPTGEDDFYLVCAIGDERSPFVVRGSILKGASQPGTPAHLSLSYLTHWMPVPAKPPANLSE